LATPLPYTSYFTESSFTTTLMGPVAIKPLLKIPSHFNYVATLPYETMSKN